MSNMPDIKVNGGITFCGLLTILFIGLKLTKVIDWSWIWVVSPLWIQFCMIFLIFAVAYSMRDIGGNE